MSHRGRKRRGGELVPVISSDDELDRADVRTSRIPKKNEGPVSIEPSKVKAISRLVEEGMIAKLPWFWYRDYTKRM